MSKTGGSGPGLAHVQDESLRRLKGTGMRITIQAKIERADGTRRTVEVLSLRKTADKVPASGLG